MVTAICPQNVTGSTPIRMTYGRFLYVFGFILISFCYISFLWAKRSMRFARLNSRHILLTHILCIGALVQLHVDPLALMIGREHYPCGAVLLQFLLIPLVGGPVVARLLSFYFRSRFESEAITTYRTSQNAKEPGKRNELLLEDDLDRRLSFMGIIRTFAFGFSEVFAQCKSISSRKLTLRSLRYLQSGHGISFLIFAVLLVPAFIATVAVIATDLAILNGCRGCRVPKSVSSVLIVQGTVVSLMTVALLYRIHVERYSDKWGIVYETILCVLLAVVSLIGYILVNYVDVGHNWDFTFVITIGVWGMVIVQTVLQICLSRRIDTVAARRRKRALQQSLSSSTLNAGHFNLNVVLNDKALAKAFEEHLQREFGVESLFFYQEVQAWKNGFQDMSPTTRATRARKIIKTFIRPDGIFCVNISSAVAKDILNSCDLVTLGDPSFPRISLFDSSMEEIRELLELGALARFKNGPKFKTLINQNLQHLYPVDV